MDKDGYGGARPKTSRPRPDAGDSARRQGSPTSRESRGRSKGQEPQSSRSRSEQSHHQQPESRKLERSTERGSEKVIETNVRRCNKCQRHYLVSAVTPSSLCGLCYSLETYAKKKTKPLRKVSNLIKKLSKSESLLFGGKTDTTSLAEKLRQQRVIGPPDAEEDKFFDRKLAKLPTVSHSMDRINRMEPWELLIPIERAPKPQESEVEEQFSGGCYRRKSDVYNKKTKPCEMHRFGHPDCWMSKDVQDIPSHVYTSYWDKYMQGRPISYVVLDKKGFVKKREDKRLKTRGIYFPSERFQPKPDMEDIEEVSSLSTSGEYFDALDDL